MNTELIRITSDNLDLVKIITSKADVLDRIVKAAEQLGLGIYCSGELDDAHLCIGVPRGNERPLLSPHITHCGNPFLLLANILEFSAVTVKQLNQDVVKDNKILVEQTIADLSQRVSKIRGRISASDCIKDKRRVAYYRWSHLLKTSVPPEYRCFHRRYSAYDFILPDNQAELCALIEHDEQLFPEVYQNTSAS